MRAPIPPDEAARQRVLESYQILRTPPEATYEDIVSLASHICQTPISTVTLIDRDRQWFKARIGTDDEENPRDVSFCAHAILRPDELLIVEDATQDARFADNELVRSDPKIRFYAGAPLVSPSGAALGTLCVIDRVPRQLTPAQAGALQALARQTMALLDARRVAASLAEAVAALRTVQGGAVSRELVQHVMGDLLQMGGIQPSMMQVVGSRLAELSLRTSVRDSLRAYNDLGVGGIRLVEQSGSRYVFEGEDLLERRDGAKAPTCYLALGFLAGIVSHLHGASAPGTEVACQSKGAPACRFVVQAKGANVASAEAPPARIA